MVSFVQHFKLLENRKKKFYHNLSQIHIFTFSFKWSRYFFLETNIPFHQQTKLQTPTNIERRVTILFVG